MAVETRFELSPSKPVSTTFTLRLFSVWRCQPNLAIKKRLNLQQLKWDWSGEKAHRAQAFTASIVRQKEEVGGNGSSRYTRTLYTFFSTMLR